MDNLKSQPLFGPAVDSHCLFFSFSTTNCSYRFPFVETSTTALCDTTWSNYTVITWKNHVMWKWEDDGCSHWKGVSYSTCLLFNESTIVPVRVSGAKLRNGSLALVFDWPTCLTPRRWRRNLPLRPWRSMMLGLKPPLVGGPYRWECFLKYIHMGNDTHTINITRFKMYV